MTTTASSSSSSHLSSSSGGERGPLSPLGATSESERETDGDSTFCLKKYPFQMNIDINSTHYRSVYIGKGEPLASLLIGKSRLPRIAAITQRRSRDTQRCILLLLPLLLLASPQARQREEERGATKVDFRLSLSVCVCCAPTEGGRKKRMG